MMSPAKKSPMQSKKSPEKNFYTTGEVARILGVAAMTVIKYCKRGDLTAEQSKLTRYRRITKESLAAFMKKHSLPESKLEASQPVRVLIADDEKDVRWTIRQVIEKLIPNALIAEASDGYTACLVAGSFAPNLVTLDLQMPQMDGFQVCSAFRSFEATKKARILVVSAFSSRQNREEIRGLGADDFLPKPFTLGDLRAKVAELLKIQVEATAAGE